MRTVIFYGMLFIANAIRQGCFTDTAINLIVVFTICSVVMDVTEFLKNLCK